MTAPRHSIRIGVLVPFTNTNLEPDLQRMRPDGISFHFTRMGGYDVQAVPDASEMAEMGAADIDAELSLIAGCRPHAVLYGCTSATLSQGRAFDRSLAQKIEQATGAITITAAGAIVGALGTLDVTKVGLATPYTGDINDKTEAFLRDEGIKTVSRGEVGKDLLSHEQGALTPGEIESLARRADHPQAQAIVLACTDLRAVEAIGQIEAALVKPVVTSNQAMLFTAMARLGITQNGNQPGRLFREKLKPNQY